MGILKDVWRRIRNEPRKEDQKPPGSWKKPDTQMVQTPKWTSNLPRRPTVKWRIPGFRQFKRLTAGLLMVVNFIIGELTLTGPRATLIFALFFILNSFLLCDYLWKTRKKNTPPD